MDKTYDPARVEADAYQRWEESGVFEPRQDGARTYCIMLPPPNVTGRLHMGHAFQDTLMDILVRYQRMDGAATLWQCGTDHAGIATQMVVERRLAAEGKHRRDIGREAFVDEVWRWKEESGGAITEQMRRLGTSVDWSHERFTMDEGLSDAVRRVFVALYREGLIYRGKRLVNWDPALHTALSDLEVISEEEDGHLWHLRYPRSDGKGHVVVATTRPETMLGDTAVAVNPEDERYTDLIGKTLELPLTGRQIPVVADDHVDPEFGSGCVKITPAHDFDDYEIGRRHDLPLINILDDDARLNEAVPESFRGLDRFEARERVVEAFREAGLLEKIEAYRHKIPRGDRSGVVLEPYLTDQWFVDLTREQTEDGRPGGKTAITDPAIEAVRSGRIEFVPGNWDKTYYQWMENIQDWCISRQLWWGHRIPAWYDEEGGVYVGHSEAEVRAEHGLADEVALRQDEDVLDTWFSSALWPFSTLGWPEQTERLARFYPTDVLVTGFDIIFFWVARMIMMGLKFMGEVPFRQVYIHGLVRDAQGQKMSKSKGNILDPLDLIDGIGAEALVAKRTTGLMQPDMAPTIERDTRAEFPEGIKAYGTDALRFTFASLATQGRDVRFDTQRIEGYRNFCNKLWNASRYVLMNTESFDCAQGDGAKTVFDRWIVGELGRTVQEVRQGIESYRFDLAARALYEFAWNEYCDWYLELTKPVLQGDDEAAKLGTRRTLLQVLESYLRLLHPFMPFLSEALWQPVAKRLGTQDAQLLPEQGYPTAVESPRDEAARDDVEWFKQVLLGLRQIRGEMDIAPSKPLPLLLEGGEATDRERIDRLGEYLQRLGRLESIEWTKAPPPSAVALAGELKLHVPLAGIIDKEAELARLAKELDKRAAEVSRLEAKLGNDGFVNKAPEAVVAKEREKLAAAQAALSELEQQRSKLQSL